MSKRFSDITDRMYVDESELYPESIPVASKIEYAPFIENSIYELHGETSGRERIALQENPPIQMPLNSTNSYVVYVTAHCMESDATGHTGRGAFFKIEAMAQNVDGVAIVGGYFIKTIVHNDIPEWDAEITAEADRIRITVSGSWNDRVLWAGRVQRISAGIKNEQQ